MLNKRRKAMSPSVVEGALLVKMTLEQGLKDGKSWEAAKLLFRKGERWVEGWIFNPRKHQYDNAGKYQSARLIAQALLENVASTFLDGDELRRLYHDSPDFPSYITHMIEAMHEEEYWTIPVDIKVLPGKSGAGTTAVRPPFMRASGDTTVRLAFSKYELELINN